MIDVRSSNEFEICQIDSSINIPVTELMDKYRSKEVFNEKIRLKDLPVYVVCRRGNDSQRVVRYLKTNFDILECQDLVGGLHAWAKYVDQNFPVY